MHKTIQPKVTLVGAGPGDPDLLTIKGANALAEAQVVLYDALANEEILTYAPKKSIKIFVGKRKGCHAYSQDEINKTIQAGNLESARNIVATLEAQAAQCAAVPKTPGCPSPTTTPASGGVP